MDKESLKPIIESLIFASETVITLGGICAVLEGEDKAGVKAALSELIDDYRGRSGGIFIEEVAGGYQFRTSPESSPWLKRLFKTGSQKLSRAAMESLAIIAYKQPVTRGELEAVRGVDSGGVLSTLMEKRLIKIAGKKDVPGKPVVYATTREFLETFDLKDLSCLPSLKDVQAPEEEDGTNVRQALEESGGAGAEEGSAEGGGTREEPQDPAHGNGRRAAGEASEGDSLGRDNVEAQGRGDDSRGPGDGERQGGNNAGDKG